MIKLKIVKIDNFKYYLSSENNKEYELKIEFHDIDKPKVNDYIFMDEDLLSINYLLAFGSIDSSYGHTIKSSHDKDVIVIISDNKEIFLKRLYG